jgi:hypothetical protein
MNREAPPLAMEPVSPTVLRHYIALARQVRPVVPKHVADLVVNEYVGLRRRQKQDDDRNQFFTYTSARTLLGVLRVAQACARLRFSPEVDEDDVKEALRLMEASKSSLHDHEGGRDHVGDDRTTRSRIYALVKQMARSGAGRKDGEDEDDEAMEQDEDEDVFNPVQNMAEIRERAFAQGFTQEELDVRLLFSFFPLPRTDSLSLSLFAGRNRRLRGAHGLDCRRGPYDPHLQRGLGGEDGGRTFFVFSLPLYLGCTVALPLFSPLYCYLYTPLTNFIPFIVVERAREDSRGRKRKERCFPLTVRRAEYCTCPFQCHAAREMEKSGGGEESSYPTNL